MAQCFAGPPADPPYATTRVRSKLYFAAFALTHAMAQRTSSMAAGAGASLALRYSTVTTLMPAASTCTAAAPGWVAEVAALRAQVDQLRAALEALAAEVRELKSALGA